MKLISVRTQKTFEIVIVYMQPFHFFILTISTMSGKYLKSNRIRLSDKGWLSKIKIKAMPFHFISFASHTGRWHLNGEQFIHKNKVERIRT